MSCSGAPGPGAEPYADGAWYDAEYVHIRADVPLYRAVAAEARGPILELAAGTGRLTFPMAERGAEVWGIDASPAMIDRARAKAARRPAQESARLHFEIGDMRTIRLRRRFAKVVLGFNGLMHMLVDADVEATLETAKVHLEPEGRFHLDLFTPFPQLPERDPDGRYDPQQMIDPRTRERWWVTESNRYDPRTQINLLRFHYRRADPEGAPYGPEHTLEIPLRVFFPRELDGFVHRAGFRIVAEHEDHARCRPYTAQGGLRVLELAPG